MKPASASSRALGGGASAAPGKKQAPAGASPKSAASATVGVAGPGASARKLAGAGAVPSGKHGDARSALAPGRASGAMPASPATTPAPASAVAPVASTKVSPLAKLRALGQASIAYSKEAAAGRLRRAAAAVGESSTHKVHIKVNTGRCVTTGPYAEEDSTHMEQCTAELGRRIATCKASGKPFVDVEFGGDSALSDPALIERCGGWHRIGDLYPGATLCGDCFDPRMPRQGRVANCYYVSALAMVASRPGFLEHVFINKKENPFGVYGVRLWHNGAWRIVWVDDTVPVARSEVRKLDDDMFYAIDGSAGLPDGFVHAPLCMRLRHGRRAAFWPMILEKAHAKLYGSYGAVGRRGWPETVLTALVPRCTGGCVLFDTPAMQAAIKSGALWQDILHMQGAGWFLVAVAAGTAEGVVTGGGIVQGHAYSLLRVEQCTGPDGKRVNLLQLRNSWATGEWNGAWSDADTARWTPAMRRELRYDPSHDKTEWDDGIFWMAWDDFTREFSSVHFVRSFIDGSAGGPKTWWHAVMRAKWPPHLLSTPRVAVDEVTQYCIRAGAHDAHVYVVLQADIDETPASGQLVLGVVHGAQRCTEWGSAPAGGDFLQDGSVTSTSACVSTRLRAGNSCVVIPMPNTLVGSRTFQLHVFADQALELSSSPAGATDARATHARAPPAGSFCASVVPSSPRSPRIATTVFRAPAPDVPPLQLDVVKPEMRAAAFLPMYPLLIRHVDFFTQDAERWAVSCTEGAWPPHAVGRPGVIDLDLSELFLVAPGSGGVCYCLLELLDVPSAARDVGSAALGVFIGCRPNDVSAWGTPPSGATFLFDATPTAGPFVACVRMVVSAGLPITVAAEHNTLPAHVRRFRLWLALERAVSTPREPVASPTPGLARLVASLNTALPSAAAPAASIAIKVVQRSPPTARRDSAGVAAAETRDRSSAAPAQQPSAGATTRPQHVPSLTVRPGVGTVPPAKARTAPRPAAGGLHTAPASRKSAQTGGRTADGTGQAASPRSPRSPRAGASDAASARPRSLSPRLQRLARAAREAAFWKRAYPKKVYDAEYFNAADGWHRCDIAGSWPETAMGLDGVVLETCEQYFLVPPPLGTACGGGENIDDVVYVLLKTAPATSIAPTGMIVLAAAHALGTSPSRIQEWGEAPGLSAAGVFAHDATTEGNVAGVRLPCVPRLGMAIAPLPNTWAGTREYTMSIFSRWPIVQQDSLTAGESNGHIFVLPVPPADEDF